MEKHVSAVIGASVFQKGTNGTAQAANFKSPCMSREETTTIAVLAPFPRQLASGVRFGLKKKQFSKKRDQHGDPGRS